MGYCTTARICLGIVFVAGIIKSNWEADSPPETGFEVIEWCEEFMNKHKITSLAVIDLTRFEEYEKKKDSAAESIWDRRFALVCASEASILETECWGHDACFSVSKAMPVKDAQLGKETRKEMDHVLALLKQKPNEYPTQLILRHSGG